jgi:RTX calcium-binding nonapeptide repeat (4 copies)
MRRSMMLAGAIATLALSPAAASAGTIAYEGDTLVVTAGPGEANSITFGGEEEGRLSISDAAGYSFPGDRCTQLDPAYSIQCDLPARIRANLGDGNDRAVLGGPGADELKAIDGNTRLTLDGGPGADILRSEGGGDVLRGGPDGDDLIGGAGADVLEGGDGDDTLTGDVCEAPAADVLDGGAGVDTLTDWGDCGPGSDKRAVRVTVNGVADDGRPGEHDDVRDLDVLLLYVPATVIGTDGSNAVEIYAAADREPSSIDGRGGADDLRSGSGRETIDGGGGDDRVEGGFNHDVLTGGPGKDVIYGDSTAGNCGGHGQSCTIPFGNDTIDARDGEADQVDCGPGDDRAVVDALDTVATNCETVEGGGCRCTGPGTKPVVATLRVVKPGRLRTVLRKGLSVRLAGFAPATVRVRVRAGRRVVASARTTVGADGTARARARFTRPARRSLSRRRSVKLVVRAGTAGATITVRR